VKLRISKHIASFLATTATVLGLLISFSITTATLSNAACFNPGGPAAPASGLVGYWALDETSGTSASDSSSNGNTGTLQAAASWTTSGQINGALTFSAAQHVNVPDAASLDIAGSWTASTWFNLSSIPSNSNWYGFLEKNPGANLNYGLTIETVGGITYLLATFTDNTSYTVQDSYVFTPAIGTWYHLAGTWDGTTLTLYLNGVSVATAVPGRTPATGSGILQLGLDSLTGTLDDVRIYNRALSAAEVAQLAKALPMQAGTMIYNGGYRIFEYCNGGSWVKMGGAGDTASGLVGYWKLDDASSGTSTTAADSSGNGLTGTTQASPVWTGSGMNGNALTLTAASLQYVKVPYTASLNLAGPWAIAAWVYPTALPTVSANLIDRDSTCNGCNSNYKLSIDNNDHCGALAWRVSFDTSGGVYHGACYVTAIPLNTWYHLAGTWDGTTLTLYLNGVSVATNVPGAVPATGTVGDLGLGTEITQARYLDGTLDDARVYNRALSAQDVKTLYTSTGGTSGDINSNLAGYWKFDEPSGSTANDSSANADIGTATGTTIVAGQIGNARSFSGTTDLVDMGDPASGVFDFGAGQDFSYSFWLKRVATASSEFIFAKGAGGTADVGYSIALSGGVQPVVYLSKSGEASRLTITGSNISDTSWHFIAATFSRTGLGSFYLDGALNATGNISGYNVSLSNGSRHLTVGCSSSGTACFNGTIDDVRVYSRALSASDVLTLYNSTATACASPVGYTGDMIYNAGTNHVPQFCNGTTWIPVGPVSPAGAGGGGCSTPAGVEGNIIFASSTSRTMDYCDGTTWRIMGGNKPIPGLVGWWNFDENSGIVANDSTGNGNTGTTQNAPTWTTSGKINGALSFNGTTQYVDLGNNHPLGAGAATVSAWINLNSFNGSGFSQIFSLGNGGLECDAITGNSRFACSHNSFTNAAYAANNSVVLNQWQLFTVVRDSSGNLTLYVNGVQSGAAAQGAGAAGAGTIGSAIGTRWDASNYFWPGMIDDVRFYNRALSASDVWRLYNGAP
jgi:Concanavalin A-like lectin/glucanases superfamily